MLRNTVPCTARYLSLLLCLFLTACFGPRINNKVQPSKSYLDFHLATKADINMSVNLTNLIVKNSQNSWAKDANWDEYIFHIYNLSTKEISIESISVIDALEHENFPQFTRRALNKATRMNKKRFKKSGAKIKVGNGSTRMLAQSIGGTLVGAGIGAGVASGGSLAISAGTLTTAGGAVIVALPLAAIGGVLKIVNNNRINNRIKTRQNILPEKLLANSEHNFNILFPATPSPRSIKVVYTLKNETHTIVLDLKENFESLHLK
jgi:hypothetical protein